MTDDTAAPPRKPALTPRAEAELAARRAREAEALRENLRRRKAQTRPKPPAKSD
jgi:hypothetical protein